MSVSHNIPSLRSRFKYFLKRYDTYIALRLVPIEHEMSNVEARLLDDSCLRQEFSQQRQAALQSTSYLPANNDLIDSQAAFHTCAWLVASSPAHD